MSCSPCTVAYCTSTVLYRHCMLRTMGAVLPLRYHNQRLPFGCSHSPQSMTYAAQLVPGMRIIALPQAFLACPLTHRQSRINRAPPPQHCVLPRGNQDFFIYLLHFGTRIHKTPPPIPLVVGSVPLPPPCRGSGPRPRFPGLLP